MTGGDTIITRAAILAVGLLLVASALGYAQSTPAASTTQNHSSSGKASTGSGSAGSVAVPNRNDTGSTRSDTGKATTGNGTSETTSPPAANVDETTLVLSDQSAAAPAAQKVSAFGIWDLVRMVLILGIVVALIYGLFYFLKRSANGKVTDTNSMRVLGSLQLPGNRSLYVVEAGRQVFLLSGGEHSLSLISEITDQESLDDIRLKASTTTTGPRKGFSELLAGVLGGLGSRGVTTGARSSPTHAPGAGAGTGAPGSVGSPSPLEFLKHQRERLRRLQ